MQSVASLSGLLSQQCEDILWTTLCKVWSIAVATGVWLVFEVCLD
jgi:hypothetical protein